MIALLLLGKRYEEKKRRPFFLMGWISRGDAHARALSHKFARDYAVYKEKGHFFVKKQLPMHTKITVTKLRAKTNESIDRFSQQLRDSRLLKRKSEGISEFLKSIAEVEKGNGEINDSYEEKEF